MIRIIEWLGVKLEAFTKLYTKKIIIVSTYNSYEWINTQKCNSIILLFIAKLLQGYKPLAYHYKRQVIWTHPMEYFKACFRLADCTLEWYDPNKEQITYHTPYSDMY